MRKRQDLDGRISSVLRLEQTIEDNVGLIELGELEGDHAIVTEAEKALTKLQTEWRSRTETLLSGSRWQ